MPTGTSRRSSGFCRARSTGADRRPEETVPPATCATGVVRARAGCGDVTRGPDGLRRRRTWWGGWEPRSSNKDVPGFMKNLKGIVLAPRATSSSKTTNKLLSRHLHDTACKSLTRYDTPVFSTSVRHSSNPGRDIKLYPVIGNVRF